MEREEKYLIVKNAVHKIAGKKQFDDDTNLLEQLGAMDVIYIIQLIETESKVDLSNKFGNDPNILTIDGLVGLI